MSYWAKFCELFAKFGERRNHDGFSLPGWSLGVGEAIDGCDGKRYGEVLMNVSPTYNHCTEDVHCNFSESGFPSAPCLKNMSAAVYAHARPMMTTPPQNETGSRYEELLPSVAMRKTHTSSATPRPAAKIHRARSSLRAEASRIARGIPPATINSMPVNRW